MELDQQFSQHQIFMDVFSRRSVAGGASKRFRPDNSVVTTQSFTSFMEDSCSNGIGDSGCFVTRNIVGLGCGPRNYSVRIPRNDLNVSAKRIKRRSEKAPVQLNSSKEIVLSVQSTDLVSNYPSRTCMLVETSPDGVFSTYLHTRIEEVKRRGHACHGDASVAHTGVPLLPESSLFSTHAIISTVSNKSFTDLCRRLREHAHDLLKAAGWVVLEKRTGSKFKKTLKKTKTYSHRHRSFPGETFTTFHKVWDVLSKRMCADYKMIRHKEMKEWKNIEDFGSNLSEMLMDLEGCAQMETSDALFQQWSLLHPFVTVVMINTQIGILRKGIPVKAATTVVQDQVKQLNGSSDNLHLQTEQSSHGTLSVVGEKRKKGSYN